MALPVAVDIDAQIAEQVKLVDAVRQAGAIRDRSALSPFAAPAFPEGFAGLLSSTIDDIAADAERRLTEHLAAHATADGENWIATGVDQAGDACPFCGQDMAELGKQVRKDDERDRDRTKDRDLDRGGPGR